MLTFGAIITISSGLGYLLPALIGLESMGVPIPGETSLILAAVLASQGKLNIVIVIAIAAGSAIVGDNIGYLLGRRFGREVLTAPGPMRERRIKLVAVGDRYFDQHGSKTVFIGRWVALIRFATAWLAGINEMSFRVFFPWNAAGGIAWSIAYGLIGYYGGNAVAKILEKAGVIAAVILGVALVVAIVVIRIRERRTEQRLTENPVAEQDPATGPEVTSSRSREPES